MKLFCDGVAVKFYGIRNSMVETQKIPLDVVAGFWKKLIILALCICEGPGDCQQAESEQQCQCAANHLFPDYTHNWVELEW